MPDMVWLFDADCTPVMALRLARVGAVCLSGSILPVLGKQSLTLRI